MKRTKQSEPDRDRRSHPSTPGRLLAAALLALTTARWWAPRPRVQAQETRANPERSPRKEGEQPRSYVPPAPWKSVEVGNFYLKQKKYNAALSRFQEATETGGDYAPAYLGLGKVYERLGFKQKAVAAYQKYLDLLPSDKQADEAKDVHRALDRLQKALGYSGDVVGKS